MWSKLVSNGGVENTIASRNCSIPPVVEPFPSIVVPPIIMSTIIVPPVVAGITATAVTTAAASRGPGHNRNQHNMDQR